MLVSSSRSNDHRESHISLVARGCFAGIFVYTPQTVGDPIPATAITLKDLPDHVTLKSFDQAPDFFTASQYHQYSFIAAAMFARNVLRGVYKPAALSNTLRSASTFSAASAEAQNPRGLEISKAQRIAHDGFVSGMPCLHVHHTIDID